VAVDPDVGDPAARAHQLGAELEGLGDAHRLDGHVGAEPVGQAHDDLGRVVGVGVDGHVGAELRARLLQP